MAHRDEQKAGDKMAGSPATQLLGLNGHEPFKQLLSAPCEKWQQAESRGGESCGLNGSELSC